MLFFLFWFICCDARPCSKIIIFVLFSQLFFPHLQWNLFYTLNRKLLSLFPTDLTEILWQKEESLVVFNDCLFTCLSFISPCMSHISLLFKFWLFLHDPWCAGLSGLKISNVSYFPVCVCTCASSPGRVRTRRSSSGNGPSVTDSRGRSRGKVVSQSQREPVTSNFLWFIEIQASMLKSEVEFILKLQ